MSYDAVLFDNDGVITELTDRDVLRAAVRDAFAESGIHEPEDEHVDLLLAGVTPDALREICDGHGLDPDEFWYRRDDHASRRQRREIREGRKSMYEDATTALADLALPAGIVSSNQQATIDFVVDHYGLGDAVGTHYGREPSLAGLRRKKPETYYLERAMADLGAESALYVGDSEVDVVAARRAGMDSVFVRRSHRREYELGVEPTHEVDGLDGLFDLL